MFTKVLSKATQKSLALLGESGLVKDAYLAGGSALALQLGHRYSVDFDFFTSGKFNSNQVVNSLERLGKFKSDLVQADTILGNFNSVKFSLFYLESPQGRVGGITSLSRFACLGTNVS